MRRLNHIATLTALARTFATSMHVAALEKSDPDGCSGGVGSDLCSGSDGGGGPVIRSSILQRCPGAAMPPAKRPQRERRRQPKGRGRKKSARSERRKQLNVMRKASAECRRRRSPRPARSDRSAKPHAMHEREIRLCAEPRGAMPGQPGALQNRERVVAADGDAGCDGGAVVPPHVIRLEFLSFQDRQHGGTQFRTTISPNDSAERRWP